MRNLLQYPITADEAIDVSKTLLATLQPKSLDKMLFGDMRPLCLRELIEFAEENPELFAEFLKKRV